jgi:enoyl-CoA hydratase/carnithine racemase
VRRGARAYNARVLKLERDGAVFVLRLEAGENRFRPALLDPLSAALDEVERAGTPCALVTTGAGRFYSNGLDTDWMGAHPDEVPAYLARVLALLARLLTFPAITVAAVNGHAFGAGGQLCVAHDFAVMRRGRGYWCMPEIDMPAPLHAGMTALLQARLPLRSVHEALVTGKRYTAEEALARGIVDEVADESDVLPRALERARALSGKAHPVMSALKRGMYAAALDALALPWTGSRARA